MTSTSLPTWVKPGAIAAHRPTRTLFSVCKAQRSPAGEALLTDAPTGGSRYPLSDCRESRITDLNKAQAFIFEGLTLSLAPTQAPDLFQLTDGQRTALVRIPLEAIDFEQSVQSFARAFDGVVLPGEVLHA